MYIIDGNNVAGKFKLLGLEHFDRKLLGLIQTWNITKQVKITVVFDGGELMGNKIAIDSNITTVYSPRDSFYKDADDMIVEIVRRALLDPGEALILVTEDRELQKRAEKEGEIAKRKIKIIKSGDFIKRLEINLKEVDVDEDRELSDKDINSINGELLKIWK